MNPRIFSHWPPLSLPSTVARTKLVNHRGEQGGVTVGEPDDRAGRRGKSFTNSRATPLSRPAVRESTLLLKGIRIHDI